MAKEACSSCHRGRPCRLRRRERDEDNIYIYQQMMLCLERNTRMDLCSCEARASRRNSMVQSRARRKMGGCDAIHLASVSGSIHLCMPVFLCIYLSIYLSSICAFLSFSPFSLSLYLFVLLPSHVYFATSSDSVPLIVFYCYPI